MLSAEQLEPMVEAARAVKEQCSRDTDKTLRSNAEKAFNETFIAQRHAYLAARKLFEAGMARTYAEQLAATPGYGRQAERERVRAATLEQQARNHARASEKCQEEGDQLESEALTVLQRRARSQQQQQLPGQAPAPTPEQAPQAPQVHRRQREQPPASDGQ